MKFAWSWYFHLFMYLNMISWNWFFFCLNLTCSYVWFMLHKFFFLGICPALLLSLPPLVRHFVRYFFVLRLISWGQPAGLPHGLALAIFVKWGDGSGETGPGTFITWTNQHHHWMLCITYNKYEGKGSVTQVWGLITCLTLGRYIRHHLNNALNLYN